MTIEEANDPNSRVVTAIEAKIERTPNFLGVVSQQVGAVNRNYPPPQDDCSYRRSL